jgi:lipid A oxidase
MRIAAFLVGSLIALAPVSAKAEFQLSVYGGANTANESEVTLNLGALSGEFDVDWFGDSFNKPPYYGLRGTYWLNDFNLANWGIAIDFTHAKVKADLDDPAVGARFDRLEFTNGLNSLTLNGLYRMPLDERFGLYAGIGAGASIPHVEVETFPATARTFEYQVTGPVVQGLVGTSVNLAYGFSLFSEYKASYSWNDADLNGGGSLETNILTHQFAVGLSFAFGGTSTH